MKDATSCDKDTASLVFRIRDEGNIQLCQSKSNNSNNRTTDVDVELCPFGIISTSTEAEDEGYPLLALADTPGTEGRMSYIDNSSGLNLWISETGDRVVSCDNVSSELRLRHDLRFR